MSDTDAHDPRGTVPLSPLLAESQRPIANPFRSPHAAADFLAGAVCRLVDDHTLDARSECADRLLDYATERFGSSEPIGRIRAVYAEMVEWRRVHT